MHTDLSRCVSVVGARKRERACLSKYMQRQNVPFVYKNLESFGRCWMPLMFQIRTAIS